MCSCGSPPTIPKSPEPPKPLGCTPPQSGRLRLVAASYCARSPATQALCAAKTSSWLSADGMDRWRCDVREKQTPRLLHALNPRSADPIGHGHAYAHLADSQSPPFAGRVFALIRPTPDLRLAPSLSLSLLTTSHRRRSRSAPARSHFALLKTEDAPFFYYVCTRVAPHCVNTLSCRRQPSLSIHTPPGSRHYSALHAKLPF